MSIKKYGDCGYIGKPAHDEYSSIMLDLLAWGFGLIIALITTNIYLVVIGPIVTVWHVLTFRSRWRA